MSSLWISVEHRAGAAGEVTLRSAGRRFVCDQWSEHICSTCSVKTGNSREARKFPLSLILIQKCDRRILCPLSADDCWTTKLGYEEVTVDGSHFAEAVLIFRVQSSTMVIFHSGLKWGDGLTLSTSSWIWMQKESSFCPLGAIFQALIRLPLKRKIREWTVSYLTDSV